MKVLYIDFVKSPSRGGGGPHRYGLIKNISKFVDIYCMSDIDSFDSIIGIHNNRLKRSNNFKIINKVLYLKSLFRLAFSQKYDIIYIRNIHAGLIGFLIKNITGSKLVFELNSITKDESKFYESSKMNILSLKVWVSEIIELFLARNSDAVISITDGIKEYLIENGTVAEKIIVVNNGVDIDFFRPEKQNTHELKSKYNIYPNDFIVLFQGTLASYQGVEYLVKSAPIIIKKIPNVMFLIVGLGIEYSRLVKLVRGMNLSRHFTFTGRIPYEEMPEYIHLADVCVAPFIRERNEKIGLSPLKLYEYMACEKPVVGSKIKGVGDLLENSGSGISVTPESPIELANAIIYLLKNKDLREEMGRNGRQICIEKHNWLKVAEKTKEVFIQLVKVNSLGVHHFQRTSS